MIRLSAVMMILCFGLACLFMPGKASANVVCSFTDESIAFGTASSATGTIGYTCVSFDPAPTSFTICSQLGFPSWPGTASQPAMFGSTGGQLSFNVYRDEAHSTIWTTANPLTKSITVPAGGTVNGSMNFYGLIPSGQGAPAGSYSAWFYNTSLGMMSAGSCMEHVSGVFDGTNNGLAVSATVSNGCTVSASNLGLGSVASNSSGAAGSTSIAVTCPSGTAYFIGLAPSNGSAVGAGTMTGTGANTDHPSYQLRSTAGMSGVVWGNTATTTSVGNGVSGTGSGAVQNFTAYVTLPSANYRPDSYSDTVTVNVNY